MNVQETPGDCSQQFAVPPHLWRRSFGAGRVSRSGSWRVEAVATLPQSCRAVCLQADALQGLDDVAEEDLVSFVVRPWHAGSVASLQLQALQRAPTSAPALGHPVSLWPLPTYQALVIGAAQLLPTSPHHARVD
eukprot:2056395-Alexandrium_andersonii.AAC.1